MAPACRLGSALVAVLPWFICLSTALCPPSDCRRSARAAAPPLIDQADAARHGLVRAWAIHVDLDRTRDRIAGTHLDPEGLLVLSERGVLSSLDAQSGAPRWSVRIGSPRYPALGPAGDEQYVVATDGSTAYVLDRSNGRSVRDIRLDGVPNASPVVAAGWIYVPLMDRLSAYEVGKPDQPPWFFTSYGTIDARPTVTPRTVVWGTESGVVYSGARNRLDIRFQKELLGAVRSSPAFRPGTAPADDDDAAGAAPDEPRRPAMVFVTSRNRYAYGLDEVTGQTVWRFSVGTPISHPPIVVDDAVLIIPETYGMFCVSAETGAQRWWTPRVARFLSASPTRVYALDSVGNILILDRQSGARRGVLPAQGLSYQLINRLHDRIYLGTETGLLMCLHEAELGTPVIHTGLPKIVPAGEGDEAGDAADADADAPADADDDNPF